MLVYANVGVRGHERLGLSGVLAATVLAASGCTSNRAFVCTEDVQCGEQGLCEANGHCSFPDVDCPGTIRRYGRFAGPFSSECVPPDTAADASSGATSSSGGGPPGNDVDGRTEDPRGSGSADDGNDPPASTSLGESAGGETAPGTMMTTDGLPTEDGPTTTGDGDATTDPSTTDTGVADDSTGSESPELVVGPCFVNNPDDGVVDAYWNIPGLPSGLGLAEINGEVTMFLVAAPAFLVMESAQGSQVNTRVTLEVLEIPNPAAQNTQLLFGLGDASDRVLYEITAGVLTARSDERDPASGVQVFIRHRTQPFDPVLHRFLRITVLPAEVSFDVSSDGVTYVSYTDPIPTPTYLGDADSRTQILGGTFAPQPVPPGTGIVRFRAFEDCDVLLR